MSSQKSVRLSRLAVLIILTFALLTTANAETLTVMHFSDSHSHLAAWGPHGDNFYGTIGGYDRLATIVGAAREEDEELLLLNAGDNFAGDIVFNLMMGVPEFQIQKELGIDAMAIGNHEFDLGPDILAMILVGGGMTPQDEDAFPLLSANLDYSLDTTGLDQIFQPYTVFERHGVRVGVFSLLTPVTMVIGMPFNEESGIGVIVRSDTTEVLLGIAGEMVQTLRGDEECDIVIALTHLGILLDMALAENVPGIDLVLGGHQHVTVNTTVENVMGADVRFISANTALQEISKVVFDIGEEGITITEAELIPINEDIPRYEPMSFQVSAILTAVEMTLGSPFYSEPVCEAETYIPYHLPTAEDDTAPIPIDSPLGNLVTDALRDFGSTDIAIEAYGFLRQDIFQGPLSEADLFQAVGTGFYPDSPYGYPLVTFELTGMDIYIALESCLAAVMLPYDLDFLMMCSGMGYAFDLNQEVEHRVTAAWVGDQPLNPEATYTITSSVALPTLMEQLFDIAPQNMQPAGTTLYEAFRDYCIENSPISAQTEGRVLPVDNGHYGSVINPVQFILAPAYPNPFNSTTTISYILPKQGHVNLTMFDITGRQVATLIDFKQGVGIHRVEWDAVGLPSGLYVCRLTARNEMRLARITLIK